MTNYEKENYKEARGTVLNEWNALNSNQRSVVVMCAGVLQAEDAQEDIDGLPFWSFENNAMDTAAEYGISYEEATRMAKDRSFFLDKDATLPKGFSKTLKGDFSYR